MELSRVRPHPREHRGEYSMKKKDNSVQELSMLTEAQRGKKQRELEKQRLEITREIEILMKDISKLKKGMPLRMQNPRRLGHRPNDVVDD